MCEQAEALWSTVSKLALNKVEIADNDALMERYGLRIPVLLCEMSQKELGWPFDEEALRVWLQAG